MKKYSYGLISALNESFDKDIQEKRAKTLKESMNKAQRACEKDIKLDEGEPTKIKKIIKVDSDKETVEYPNKNPNDPRKPEDPTKEEILNETGEWDDNDEEMQLWLDDLGNAAKELELQTNGEVQSVKGFDAYVGPYAIIRTPKHGDIELWYDQEDDTGRSFIAKVAHVGWISGGINGIANLLNQDKIPDSEIINEDEDLCNKQILNEDSYEFDKLVQGEDLYFRNSEGIPLLGHYASNYPKIEEYDEGLLPENGATKEEYQDAKNAEQSGDVWEFLVVDENTLEPTSEVYTYIYGNNALYEFVTKQLRPVKIKRSLEESWTDVYNKFTAIVDKHNPSEENFENNISKEVEELYSKHRGESDWDEAYKRWLNESDSTSKIVKVVMNDTDVDLNQPIYNELESKYNVSIEANQTDELGNYDVIFTGTKENIKNAINDYLGINGPVDDEEFEDSIIEESKEIINKTLDKPKKVTKLVDKTKKESDCSFKDKVKAIKKSLMKDKRKTSKSAQKSAENIAGSMVKEEDIVLVNTTTAEPDYVITDVTELDYTNPGDVQSPDIDAMLTMIQESIKDVYGPNAINIHIHSSNLLENGSFALVDIQTPEILKEFSKTKDTAVGKSLILENKSHGLYEFRVNNTSGTTRYLKRTKEPAKAIYEWLETEFLSEAKKAKEEEQRVHNRIKLEDTINQFLNNNKDLQLAIETIKMYIDAVGKEGKEAIKPMIEKIAVEFPVGVSTSDDSLKFDSREDVIEILFGKEWIPSEPEEVKPSVPGTKVIKEGIEEHDLSKDLYGDESNKRTSEDQRAYEKYLQLAKDIKEGKNDTITLDSAKYLLKNAYVKAKGYYSFEPEEIDKRIAKDIPDLFGDLKESDKLNESYQQFNIGEIEVVYNPETQEVMYSVGADDKHDKKINLTKIPSVEVPYNTETIIKNYIEKQYGPIPEEIETDTEEGEGEALPTETIPAEDETQLEEDDNEISQDAGLEQSEPSEDEALEDSKPETGSAKFQKIKPNSGVSVEDLRTSELDGTVQADSQYIVVEEINLSDSEFAEFSNDVSKPQDFFTGVTPLDRKNYPFNVVKITNENSPYDIVADPVRIFI